ncbi:GNAT family N-acetyltransferase [Leucothrix sargassi]|nr:GNAT family N-acetyltransferase [Leucothrix sargassi]
MATSNYAFANDSFKSFLSNDICVRPVNTDWERKGYYALRKQTFAKEQKILANNEERDSKDFQAIAIVALASNWHVDDEVIGAVRIYLESASNDEEQIWYGGRLCVSRPYRGRQSIGKALINEAVSRAIDLGCTQFYATVQPQNESYFHTVHWKTVGEVEVAGRPHVYMQADLSAYPFMPRCR